MKLESVMSCWNMSQEQYVKLAVINMEEDIASNGKILLSKYVTLISINYARWLEDSKERMADVVNQY